MEPSLILIGDGGTLSNEVVNSNGWSYCYLEDGGTRIFLGADSREHILSRLLGILGEEDELAPATWQYNGYSVRCSLMLSEVHHALYVADAENTRFLFWQNANAAALPIVGVIKLSAEQRHQWLAQIKEVSPDSWPSFQGSSYLNQKPKVAQGDTVP